MKRCLELVGRYAALLVFAIALFSLWQRFGHWFFLSIDEGIYLEGAKRVAQGQVPYGDFLAITGPGSFWIYGWVFRLLGTSFAHARMVLCCELAATCAAICWLTGRFTGPAFGVASGLLYLAMLLTSPYPIYVTHRWDSNAFALFALAFTWAGGSRETGGSRWLLVAGICAGTACWFTPPLAMVCAALAIWIALVSESRLAGC